MIRALPPVELTEHQRLALEPALTASTDGGGLMCQVKRGRFPEHETLFLVPVLLDAQTAKKVQAILGKEDVEQFRKPTTT